ncbi:hypothetical protein ABZP36_031047 [Zizania latifolia]
MPVAITKALPPLARRATGRYIQRRARREGARGGDGTGRDETTGFGSGRRSSVGGWLLIEICCLERWTESASAAARARRSSRSVLAGFPQSASCTGSTRFGVGAPPAAAAATLRLGASLRRPFFRSLPPGSSTRRPPGCRVLPPARRCPFLHLPRKMLNLIKIKDKKKEQAASAAGKAPVKKQSAGELRLHKDISELNLPKSTSISFPNGKDDLMNFEIIVRPDEGFYLGGTFVFTFQVSPSYPHEPPKVKCKTKVYHPNIDLEGNVCLNILREDWKPVLNIITIIYGLNLLFTQPNDEDPLNHEAAAVLRDNPKLFEANVKRAMAGGYVGQHYFPRCA